MGFRAAVCTRYGEPESVEIHDLPGTALTPGAARVAVEIAAVNYPDVLVIADRYQVSVPTPFIPGSEFAGVITEVGDGTEGVSAGDRVTGTGLFGAFAQEVVVDAARLTPIPEHLTTRQAAAAGVAYRTAYHSLRSVAGIRKGDTVVVLGAGGGVGLAAVALATSLGAEVVAVASTRDKLDAAQRHGARHLVDHRGTDLREALRAVVGDGADAVIDPVGGSLSEPALRSLRRGGRFVTIGFASGDIPRIPLNLVLVKGVTVAGFQFTDIAPDEFSRNEDELAELLRAGTVEPHVGGEYPLEQTSTALRIVADGQAIGKILIRVGDHP
ncbi:NADPH:quinone oxidoreductase family protein [Gordonia sp. CPCC 206044]|uniref:NADPH:quinone oxidoreductase family protein n=1 Tax=Gordonia sp. CPCC 206044 TaxID=3140793 RepID=UPI003AF38F9B